MDIIQKEIENLNNLIIKTFIEDKSQISNDICNFLNSKSKKLRPTLIFLFAKSLNCNITKQVFSLAAATELIHNSTLIHDDIIDNAETRRGNISLNYKLGNNLSVLAGDMLLSVALQELLKCQNSEIINIYTQSLYTMCKGEINQHYTINKIPSLEEYISKSEHKTAELFKASLLSLFLLLEIDKNDAIYSFAKNFGIAFQIKDDLLNILNVDNSKPQLSDINNGIYTAPVIFLNEEEKYSTNLKKENIKKKLIQTPIYIDKTIKLVEKYANRAIESIDFIPNNEYKMKIIQITQNLYKVENKYE